MQMLADATEKFAFMDLEESCQKNDTDLSWTTRNTNVNEQIMKTQRMWTQQSEE